MAQGLMEEHPLERIAKRGWFIFPQSYLNNLTKIHNLRKISPFSYFLAFAGQDLSTKAMAGVKSLAPDWMLKDSALPSAVNRSGIDILSFEFNPNLFKKQFNVDFYVIVYNFISNNQFNLLV